MLPRTRHLDAVSGLLARHPIVAILGARQVGKSTLARQVAAGWPGPVTFLDLETPGDLARLADPMLGLRILTGLVVVDEVQQRPDLFPVLRVLADRPGAPARFLILGSASPRLVKGVSESLAGRVAFHDLGGFAIDEAGADALERLWIRGGFPRSFLAGSDADSAEWRRDFVRTVLERDLPDLGLGVPPATLRRFWTMLAHRHAQVWNASELGRAFGVSHHAVGRYLDLLMGTFLARRLPPWFENVEKRQVKAPKVYLADSGLVHTLLNLETRADVTGHPVCGATWEGFVLDAVLRRLGARADEAYFWATHSGAELDLLVVRGNRRLGFEIKRTTAPRLTPSMRTALADLHLESLVVVHAGEHDFLLAERVRAVPVHALETSLTPL
jgi:predicted AAA+ superfamily ATPase